MNPPSKIPLLYFDPARGNYWLQLPSRRFLSLTTEQARMHLVYAGLYGGKVAEGLNAVDAALYQAQTVRPVDYAGALAGHRCGPIVTRDGCLLLVTSEPNPAVFSVPKTSKPFPKIERFFEQLFGDDQLPYVLGWLKMALESLRSGDLRPGQLLVLAGPSGCGKSLFQALVTVIFGGRVAQPYRYMIGETSFNADLAKAEHLMIEDENASTDIRTRRKFGSALKTMTVNSTMSVHGKGQQAITLPSFRRITLSVNNEPENLVILPPLDESIKDKLTLCKCDRAKLPKERLELWQSLTDEIPALASFLSRWRLPKALHDDRYGVASYHHPDLLDQLSEISHETRLLQLIEDELLQESVFVELTANEIERRLVTSTAWGFTAQRLLYYTSACGVYLARLATKFPQRVSKRTIEGKTLWKIKA